MDDPQIHEAMEKAIQAVKGMYRDEQLSDVEIEEFEHADLGDWIITVGFTRPKKRQTLGGLSIPVRALKRVTIDRQSGVVKSIKMYQPNT